MSYELALRNAWKSADDIPEKKRLSSVKFLSDSYTVDFNKKIVISDSCNIPAKEYISILILHYLASLSSMSIPAPLTGEWVDFNQLEGGEGYYPAFKKRTIDRVVKKYGDNPESITELISRIPGRTSDNGDVSIIVYPLNGIEILITLSKADDEFGPGANILFDKNISRYFCTEDIVVLTEVLVHQI